MYKVSRVVKVSNVTVVVYGHVSRLGVDLDIYVWRSPRRLHSVGRGTSDEPDGKIRRSTRRISFPQTTRKTSYPQPIPDITTIKITAQPLILAITISIKG